MTAAATRWYTTVASPRAAVAALILSLASLTACSRGGMAPTATSTATTFTTTSSTVTMSSAGACAAEHGSLSYRSVPAGDRAVRVAIYLPPCAIAGSSQRYPTIYLLHGGGTDETQWPAIGVAATADRLIVNHQIAPVIVVMPSSGVDPGDSSLQDHVVPWADANLPTLAARSDRAIGGISLGGGAALRIVATHPTLFSRLGGHSSTVPADNALLSMLGSWGGPVWLDVGDADNLRSSIEALARTLQADGVRAQVHVWPGTHNRAYWGAHVADYLRFYTAGWPSPRAGGS